MTGRAADVLDHLERFRIGVDDLEAFADVLNLPVAALRPPEGMRFTGDVRAVPEGAPGPGSSPVGRSG